MGKGKVQDVEVGEASDQLVQNSITECVSISTKWNQFKVFLPERNVVFLSLRKAGNDKVL